MAPPERCTCEPYAIAESIRDTLGCPLPWRFIPAEGIWVHAGGASDG